MSLLPSGSDQDGISGLSNTSRFRLAYFELRAILSRVLWHFDMELEKESQGWPEQKVHDLWDKPPLWIKLTRKADN